MKVVLNVLFICLSQVILLIFVFYCAVHEFPKKQTCPERHPELNRKRARVVPSSPNTSTASLHTKTGITGIWCNQVQQQFVFPLYLNSALQIWTVSQVADGVLFISTSTVYGAALATYRANSKLMHLLGFSLTSNSFAIICYRAVG